MLRDVSLRVPRGAVAGCAHLAPSRRRYSFTFTARSFLRVVVVRLCALPNRPEIARRCVSARFSTTSRRPCLMARLAYTAFARKSKLPTGWHDGWGSCGQLNGQAMQSRMEASVMHQARISVTTFLLLISFAGLVTAQENSTTKSDEPAHGSAQKKHRERGHSAQAKSKSDAERYENEGRSDMGTAFPPGPKCCKPKSKSKSGATDEEQ